MRELLVFAASSILLYGCHSIRYEMRAPFSDAGRACVTQCAAIKETCRGNEIRRAKSEREACEHRADQALRSCLAAADSKDRRNECEKKKPGCWSYEDYGRCEEDHRACYGQCGGTVIKIVE